MMKSRAGEHVQHGEEFSSAILDALNALVVVLDADGRVVLFNPACERVSGHAFEQAEGRRIWNLVLPAEHVARAERMFAELRDERFPEKFENEWLARDGSRRRIAWSNTALTGADGMVEYVVATGIDVTEHRRAEQALRWAQFSVDCAGQPVFWLGCDARISYVNDAACRALGYARAELLTRTVYDISPDVSAERWGAMWGELKRVGSLNIESRHRRKDGRVFPVEISASYLEFDGREFVCTFARDLSQRKKVEAELSAARAELEERVRQRTASLTAVNLKLEEEVRERKRAEAALRASEQRLQAILDNTSAVIYVKDTAGRYLLVNRRYEELFHRASSEIIGQTDHAVFLREVADAFQANDRKVLEADAELELEEVAPHDDGMHTYISVKFPLRDAEGRAYAVCGISTDITERKRAEEALRESESKFRTVTETSAAAVFIFQGSKLRYANPAAQRITGYSADELLAMDFWDVIHPDHRELVRERGLARQRGDAVAAHYEVLIRTKSGRQCWVDYSAGVVAFEGGPAVLGTAFDVTERKLAEEAARQHQAKLAHVTRLSTMGELASGLAHELNQPLAAIVNYTRGCVRRLESDSGTTQEVLDVLEEVTAQAERAAGIIKHLRGFLRKRDPQRTNASINELVRSAAGLVAFEARELGMGVRFELADELPPVEVDKVQIEQVILNLVRNGLEAMRDGAPDGKELLIRTAADDSAGQVSVAVRDAGRGLSADELDRVFEAFYTTKAGGMGMGLSISRSIIEAHGGRLWAAENPGGGTTFEFALPAGSLGATQ